MLADGHYPRPVQSSPPPPRAVLERLDVDRVVRYLGGRVNAHWLAVRDGTEVVLRRNSIDQTTSTLRFEARVLEHLAGRGWPVPRAIGDGVVLDGHVWETFSRLRGRMRRPRTRTGEQREQRERGRLLAHLHVDLRDLVLEQRDGWIRREEVLALDPSVETALRRWERKVPAEVRVLRRYAERARSELDGVGLPEWPPIVIHGDFARWNLLFAGGRLSGVLDWELSHVDHRIADFALSWRGHYDDVLLGYEDVTPLDSLERELIRPYYWLWVLEGARRVLLQSTSSTPGLDWHVKSLLRSSQAD
jgi:aminoglycoside phosphotransferase (APT) family kinase protein